MRLLTGKILGVVCAAQAVVCLAQTDALQIPPLKTSITLEGQSVAIAVWGSISAAPSGVFRLSATVDLGDFQEHLTPILSAQLNRSDRCGERLSVNRAVLAPAGPAGLLTAYVHFERFGCAKALGKEIVKRLVGGDAVVEVKLTPTIAENHIALAAEVRKIDADGSLGDVLRSGSFGDSIREKIKTGIESSLQKSADLRSTLPAGLDDLATLETLRFADGGAGRLWLTIDGAVRLSAEQFQGLAKQMTGRR
jgi:hypothetical protein